MRLHNKVAVVTGGNKGIGRGIVEHFLAEGAIVVAFARDKQSLAELKQTHPQILAVNGDVTKEQDLKRLFQETEQNFGKIDILIANSGVGERVSVADMKEADFDYMVNINYKGTYFTVNHALSHLNDGAAIILIGSVAAYITLHSHSIYSSTKAAIIKLAENFARDLAVRRIRVNSISPGIIETPIFNKALKEDPDYLKKWQSLVPIGRIGTPLDIAYAACFLASDEATYITGSDLVIDGGLLANYQDPLANIIP
ncbi:acetyoacetyl CoA reductase [Legionella busanensis]|uniref:Acetyoacetyl CoA reductase n=1 Tax=Legionella busanensis TaxID=190655 RepID=A0A378JN46_9GAMM|nr:SDR family oxidoreductase [Legionella busanensis]STX51430.1 acetyoacetyl CoA reductase [Legionella busanensis]